MMSQAPRKHPSWPQVIPPVDNSVTALEHVCVQDVIIFGWTLYHNLEALERIFRDITQLQHAAALHSALYNEAFVAKASSGHVRADCWPARRIRSSHTHTYRHTDVKAKDSEKFLLRDPLNEWKI
jgi:hypothetical protein